jgi:hypothetical protein
VRDLKELERECIRQIRELQEEHAKQLASLFKHLTAIHAVMTPEPVILRRDSLDPASVSRASLGDE